jgi:probable rRNA maturation factor
VRAVFRALDDSGCFAAPPGELSIAILDAVEMGKLHARFFNDPSPTDVITFDGEPALNEAGEICVCADVARDYAKENGENFAAELTLYLVHGYLHLAGFDDRTAPDRRRMRAAEQEAIAVLASRGVRLRAGWEPRPAKKARANART